MKEELRVKVEGRRKNGANGRSDPAGRGTVRVTASDSGSERVSIKKEEAPKAQGRRMKAKLRIRMFDVRGLMFDLAKKS